MRLLKTTIHPTINITHGCQFTRPTARAIVFKQQHILLM